MKNIMIVILWLAVLGGIGYVVLAVPLGGKTMMERAVEVMEPKKPSLTKAEQSRKTAHPSFAPSRKITPAPKTALPRKPADPDQLTNKDRQKLDQLIQSKLKVEKVRG